MSKRRLPKGVLPFLILVIGVFGAVMLIKLKPEPPKRPSVVHLPTVHAVRVDDGTPQVTISGFGSVAARRRITLVPQVSGVVLETAPGFENGGAITAGDVLVSIDDADYRLALQTAKAQVARQEFVLAQADQEAAIAQREWQRIQAESGDVKLVRPHPLVLHGPQIKLAGAELESAKAALTYARLNLDRCVIRAPFDGRVIEESVDAGQYIRQGTPIATIYATDMADVVVPLDDADLVFFSAPDADGNGGAVVEIVADFAGRHHEWHGRVVRIAGALDPRTRLVETTVAIDGGYLAVDGRPALLDGMFVEVKILGRELVGAVSIPRSALRDDNVVWVLNAEQRITFRNVTVARVDRETALVTSGLRPGDEIVTSQLDVITDGMKVRVSGRPSASSDAGGES